MFHTDDTRVGTEFPGELVRTDIHSVYAACAFLQQDFRKSAGGCAEVDGGLPMYVQPETVERREEFQRASADIRESFFNADFAVLWELMPRFGNRCFADEYVSGEYFRLGALAGFEQSALYK